MSEQPQDVSDERALEPYYTPDPAESIDSAAAQPARWRLRPRKS
jgi:hypothetical protein